MMRRESSFLDEISFKARVFELSHFPVSVKSPLGAIRRVPKVVPYDPNARDGDNDGLVQEGTIWERPNGAVFRGLARGARKLAGAVDLVDGNGNRIDYKPGDHENSPLRGGRVERRIRGRGQRRLNRAERRRQRAQRERERAPEQREELDALDQQIARLENAVAEDSRQRMLEAEADTEEWNDEMNSFLDGLLEGWGGIRKGKNTPKGNEVARAVEKLEGERRQVGDANGRTPKRDHEDLFDDQILPEGVDRDEHRRKLDQDPDYRREWNRRLVEGERNEDGTVDPPRDGEMPSIPRNENGEVERIKELDDADLEREIEWHERWADIDPRLFREDPIRRPTRGGRSYSPADDPYVPRHLRPTSAQREEQARRKRYLNRLKKERSRRQADGEWNIESRPEESADIPEVDADEVRSVQELIEAVREQDAGSLPDDRSRRNVRNRFPQRGLPEEAFWRNDDYEPRDGRDRDAEISEHDRRFGRYYDDDGNLNDRGRLVNEQLREEREEADAPESREERLRRWDEELPSLPETPESQGGGDPDPDADVPEDDARPLPSERLRELIQEDIDHIENLDRRESLRRLVGTEEWSERIDNEIDFIDSFMEELDEKLDADAISDEEYDDWARRATDVRDQLDAERVDIRREVEDRDSQIDADMDAEQDLGRVVEGSFSNLKQRMEDEGLRWHSDKLRFLSRLSDEEVEDAFRDAVAQGDARTERRGRLRRDEVSADSKAIAEDYARRIFNKFADDHAEAYFDIEEGEIRPDLFENWEPLEELRETLTEGEWTHLEDAFNNWGNGNTGEEGFAEAYGDQVDGDPDNIAMWNPFIEEFEAEISNANPHNPFEFREPDAPEGRSEADADAPDPDLPDLGEAEENPPWPVRRYDEMGDRELNQRLDRIIAADPNGFRGFRLDERDALIEERRRRREAGVRISTDGNVQRSTPDPDSDSPEADWAVQQQENLINEWNNLLDDPDDPLLFRSVDELGQIARGEFPVGDIDPVTAEQRASFQQLARRQIEQRAIERELPGGLTVFDVDDMDDDQLNTRIAGLVAADPVGDNHIISAQLRALQQERARRQGFDPLEQRLIDALDDEELQEVIDGGPLSEMLGESAQISASVESRRRARRSESEIDFAADYLNDDGTENDGIRTFEVIDKHDGIKSIEDELSDFEEHLLRERGREAGMEALQRIQNSIVARNYSIALDKVREEEGNLLPPLPGDPDPRVPFRRLRKAIESHQAREKRDNAIERIVTAPHTSLRDMQRKHDEVKEILGQALDGYVSDAELGRVIDALSEFDTPRVEDQRRRADNLANTHNYLNSKRNQLIMLRDMRRNKADANPDERAVLHPIWDEDFLLVNDEKIADVLENIGVKIANLRIKKAAWENELKARRSDGVRPPDENVEPFLPEDLELMENLLNLRVEFQNKFTRKDSELLGSKARSALLHNREMLYSGFGHRGGERGGDLHHGAEWANEITEQGETLERIGGVEQRDLSGLNNEDLARFVVETMIPRLRKKINRGSNRERGLGNDEEEVGVAGVDGHIVNVDRALAELDRRWDEARPNDEVRRSLRQARKKLRNIRTGENNTRINLEAEREIRVNAENRRVEGAKDLDVQARDAVQARKDHMEQFSNILAVNGIGDMDINDRGFDENAVEIREALEAILEDPENSDAPRLYVELNNWAQRASEIGQTHGIVANEFFGGDNNGWQPLTELPEDALKNNQNFSGKAYIVKQLLSDHKGRMNEKVFDDVYDRRLADLANMEDMLQNFDDEGMDSLLQEVVNDFGAVELPRVVDRQEFQSRFNTFQQRLDSIKALHKERKDRKEVNDFNAKAEELLVQIPRNDDGLSPEERKEILGDAIREAMLIESGNNQFSGDVEEYRKLLWNAREDVDREVWKDKRAANGIEELPEQVVRGDINDSAIGNAARSGLVEHDSNGKPILKQVPIGNKGMNTQKDADTYLANGGHMKDVPSDFLSDAIFANSSEKNATDGTPFDASKRFHSGGLRVSNGINARAGALTTFEDQSTGAKFGIKYHGGGYGGGGVFFGENEDVGEIIGADLLSHFGFLQGRVARGGNPVSTERRRAAPLVFEFAQEITPDGDFEVASDSNLSYRDVVSGDLVKTLLGDALLHNTDRHGANYGFYRDRNGDLRLYPIDNSLIDGARDGVQVFDHRVNNVKKYLRGMAAMQKDPANFRTHLQGRYASGDTAIREAVEDFMDRLETFDANALESLVLNMMPEVEADRVELGWLKERVEELRGLGVDAVMELILE